MDCITFNLAAMHRHGTAFYDFLRIRKRYFVDELGWDLPHDDEVEMDQYDNPTAWYVVVRDDDDVVRAGARVMPATAQWGSHGIMLKDAARGRLGGIAPDIMEGIEIGGRAWEITRFVMSPDLTSEERGVCLSQMASGVTEVALRHGASELVCLSHNLLARTLRGMGFPVERKGASYRCADDGRDYAVLSMPLSRHMVLSQPATAGLASRPGPAHAPRAAVVHAPQKA
jgi:acyl homoserine lactone synthase